MFHEKIKSAAKTIQQSSKETLKLLWQFKWYICVYVLFYLCYVMEYFSPPGKDSPMWSADAMKGDWVYTNQEVYIGSLKTALVELFFLFLIGTSNMRNHPILAKLIFLSPWICMLLGIIFMICEWSWGLLS